MVTLWLLGLVGAAGLAYWVRSSLHRAGGRKLVESERRAAATRQREQDRLDCEALEESLAGRFASDGEPPAGAPRAPRQA